MSKVSGEREVCMAPPQHTQRPAHLIHRLLEHHDRAVHLLLLRRRQRRPRTAAVRTPHLHPHQVGQLKQLLRTRRQRRAAQRARLRHALRPQLPHAPRAERVAARQPHRLARRLQADQASIRVHRRRALPLVLRVNGGGEDVGPARGAVAAVLVVLLGREGTDGVNGRAAWVRRACGVGPGFLR